LLMPVLDPVYQGKPMDWSFERIQMLKGVPEVAAYPESYKNPYAMLVAPRDQKDRGTCVGQSTAYCYDLKYIMLTKDTPTDEDGDQYKKDVIDSIGTLHDVLYPQSASAEGFYQISRKIGNVTYPSGSEIRFSARAWCTYGMNLESQWHTDKKGTMVWMYEPRQTTDGGLSPPDAATFAALHRAEGWAQVGMPGGNPTWDEVCSAIYQKGFVLGAIPVYENYSTMEGGDGKFPDPRGAIAGFHALCFYGYDRDNLYLIHSWGDWCKMYGAISYNFFRAAQDMIQFFVILDENETKIGESIHKSILVTSNVPAHVSVNGVLIGNTPIKIPTEIGKSYVITVSADGYIAQSKVVDDNMVGWSVMLDPITLEPKKWYEVIIDWIANLIRRIFYGR